MKKPGAKTKNTTKMAPRMPNGTEVVDITKGTWKIGDAIGSGGFGLIYLTQKCPLSGPVSNKAEHVMKLEPHDSGPLFCEQAFFQRATKQENVKLFMSSHGLKSLGLPSLFALGSHTYNGEKLRFLVIPRFNTDLQKLFENNGRKFNPGVVFRVGMQVLDVLEYIHSQGYAHADIKAANLMIGNKDPNQVYLIDYGLAFKFLVDGNHKEYKEDPRRAHDGTAEYASRDAHNGVWPSARGDLETLGYCMWQWLSGKLPWEADVNNKPTVANKKNKYMGNIDGQVGPLIKDQNSSKGLCKYLSMVFKLQYNETPDYNNFKQLFMSILASLKCKLTDKLDFSSSDAVLQSPPRRSNRVSKIQSTSKPVQSIGNILKSPVRQAPSKTKDANAYKSPARIVNRERMFSPSPPVRSRVTKATNEETASRTTRKVANAATSSNVENEVQDSDGASRKRKRIDADDEATKKTKIIITKTVQSIGNILKSPVRQPPSKTRDANTYKSPARVVHERMFSPSPPLRSRVTKEETTTRTTRKAIENRIISVANAATSVEDEVQDSDVASRKRKRVDAGDETSPSKKKMTTNNKPALSRSPSSRVVHPVNKLKMKTPKIPKVCSGTQTTPGLKAQPRLLRK